MVLFNFSAFAGSKKDVYIFSKQGCPFCAKLEEDLNDKIIKNNPSINFIILKVDNNENFNLLRKFLSERKIKGNIGLPMVFVGENYFMGWGNTELEDLFNKYLEEYKKN